MKKEEILKKLKEINKKKYSILKLGLFGSFSKNSDTANSDIDILVKMEFKKGMYQNFCNLHKRLEEIFQKKVDLVDESMFEYKFKNPKVQKYKDEIKEEIFDCINKKNSHDIKKILENNKFISENVKQLIYKIPELSGDLEDIEKELLKYEMNDDIKEILFELKQLNNLLFKFHKKSKIVFDFSIVKNLNYYNGIILQGYIEGFPNVILTGGRYDKLFEKFGVDTGAVGFAILTDSLKGYYKDEDKNDFEILIAYDNSDFEKLVEIVNDFQEKGLRVRTENIENLKENDSEIFNYDEKYLFKNGNLIKE